MVNMKYNSIKNEVTIVIPCKNEKDYIGETILSIVKQDGIRGTRIIIADADSTDGTSDILESLKDTFSDVLNIEVIKGGKVGYGRNCGADLTRTKYVLFMDADSILLSRDVISSSLHRMKEKQLKLLTCKIKSTSKDIKSKIAFAGFNFINKFISIKTPFAIGGFFMVELDSFKRNGGFDESLDHSEDYMLSKKYNPLLFTINNRYYGQDNRRFKKMGYLGMLKMIINGYINRNNPDFFKSDIGYWK